VLTCFVYLDALFGCCNLPWLVKTTCISSPSAIYSIFASTGLK